MPVRALNILNTTKLSNVMIHGLEINSIVNVKYIFLGELETIELFQSEYIRNESLYTDLYFL